MPIFEYRCRACEHRFERLVRGQAESPPRCPECDSPDVEKLLSLPSVSSDQTRARASQDIRSRNRATRRDHAEAEVARIEAHAKDHDD
jgi:putative FmdB family regulatory protein